MNIPGNFFNRWLCGVLTAAVIFSTAAWAQPVTLKVALLPIFDVLPFYAAEAAGHFDSDRFRIIGLPVGSALERDQLLQAGEIDGVLNEMTTVAGFNRDGVRVKIVGMGRHPAPGRPLFRLLTAPESGIRTPAELAGVPIAVSINTIIEYVTDRLLVQEGLTPDQIVKKSVPVIPERYQLLMQGRLKAAMIPDPLAESALAAGAGQVLDDTADPRFSVSVLTFTAAAIEDKPEAVRFFLAGWDRAAADITAHPDRYRQLLLEKIRVPPNIRESCAIPPFPRGKVPDAGQWADIQEWMVQKGLLAAPLPYASSVTDAFLPR